MSNSNLGLNPGMPGEGIGPPGLKIGLNPGKPGEGIGVGKPGPKPMPGLEPGM